MAEVFHRVVGPLNRIALYPAYPCEAPRRFSNVRAHLSPVWSFLTNSTHSRLSAPVKSAAPPDPHEPFLPRFCAPCSSV